MAAGGTCEGPAGESEQRSDGEEREVPGGLIVALAYVVDCQDVVIDDPLHQVEKPPADQQSTQ